MHSLPYHTPPLRNRPPGEAQQTGPVERRSRPRDGQPGGRVRTQLRLRLVLSCPPGREAEEVRELLTGDLSTGGVFVSCPDPPQVGERAVVEVHRMAGGIAFSARGRVVWRRPAADRLGRPPGFGLSFERLDVRSSTVLGGLIDFFQRQQLLSNLKGAPEERKTSPWADRPEAAIALYGMEEIVREVTGLVAVEVPKALAGALGGAGPAVTGQSLLWGWADEGVSIPTLSCVDPALGGTVRKAKALLVMLAVVLDHGSGAGLLDDLQLLLLAGGGPHPQGQPGCLDYARRLHGSLQHQLSLLPRHGEFASLLRLDLSQLIHGVRYMRLLHQAPHLGSEHETQALFVAGLPLLLAGSVDLCASPSFDARETGLLREILGRAQRMAYTGHVLMNWERQCGAGDLSSGAVAHGLSSGTLSLLDLDPVTGPLRGAQLAAKLRQARVDSHYLTEWLRDRYTVRELAARLRTIDVGRLLQAHQQLSWLQFQGKGLV